MYSLRVHSEINLKSDSARRRCIKILLSNLRTQCRRENLSADIKNRWDRISIQLLRQTPEHHKALIRILTHTPGIHSIEQISEEPFEQLEDAYELIKDEFISRITNKTFVVRVKRSGHHSFSSPQAERYFGHRLLKDAQSSGVDVRNPDVTLKVNITNQRIQKVQNTWTGLGGFPIGTQGEVLSLISGGFDSGVASYQSIRRGLKTHFIFFNLGGVEHEYAVEEMARHIWQTYSSSHQVRFISVPFEGVLNDILSLEEQNIMGVILKRQMLNIAAVIARKFGASALVTGEALAQVSSQTLENLASIDKSQSMLCLRPLIFSDKQQIIDQARHIGIEDMAANIPEYCSAISKNPLLCVNEERLVKAEAKLSQTQIDKAIRNTRSFKFKIQDQGIKQKAEELKSIVNDIEIITQPENNDQIIDIRHPDERLASPLDSSLKALEIPFYELDNKVASLDKNTRYLLYCQQGSMSKMHAIRLRHQGQFGTFKPNK